MDMRIFSVAVIWMIAGTQALKCRLCSGVVSLDYCVQTTQCEADEECFTERVVGDDSAIFFNSGCLKKQVCAILATLPTKRSSLQLCDGCCADKDLCNTNLCRWPAPHNRTECYSCENLRDPNECTEKIACNDDEICYTGEYYTFDRELRYRVGCETKQRCDILNDNGKKRMTEIQICNECCAKSGCNRHLCPRPFTVTTTTTAATSFPTTDTLVTSNPMTSTLPSNNQCADSPKVDCQTFQDHLKICDMVTQATRVYCPKFCKLCS